MCDDAISLLFLLVYTSVYTGLSSVPGRIKQFKESVPSIIHVGICIILTIFYIIIYACT
jgi:hypothetical protein